MKKWMSAIALMVFMTAGLGACGKAEGDESKTDVANIGTEPVVTTETSEMTETSETAENISADIVSTSGRIIYAGETYTWQEITITIPEAWTGKYIIKELENGNGFSIYQKASVEKDENFGFLCSISRAMEYWNYGAGETLVAYTDDGTLYYLQQPTDVTCYLEDEAVMQEYSSMIGQVAWLAGGMQIAADNVHFDVDQYELPVSSIMVLEEDQVMNLSDNELWIARNEIYARHGRTFKNEYLQSYFNSCSWYQPIEGKTDVAESELSEIERTNIDLIVAAEEAFEKKHPYPKQYAVGTTVSEPLQGDGTKQKIIYETSIDGDNWEHTSILTIDGKQYDLDDYITMFSPVQDVFYITDIAESDMIEYDDGLEIAILDDGPSDDPVTHFFKYDGDLHYVGVVEGYPFEDYGNGIQNKDQKTGINGFTHFNSVIGTGRTDLIETAYVDTYYWYDRNEWSIKQMDIGFNKYKWHRPHELYVDIPVYFSMDTESPMLTMPAQEEVYFIETDMEEWIFVRGKDGTQGYIQVKDGNVQNVGAPAEEVFSDLYFFG